ncbi:hypothetical protein ACGFK1_30975 [Mycobacterium sp. NPDC048908]|uniref:hypothetical protein n=1 Tax=Mycobacterium sp. NPDC048908 TaxID=3364292 RepID=UPI003718454C
MFSQHRHRLLAGVVALLVAVVAACGANPPDRRADVASFTDRLREMPGVVNASYDFADSRAQGLVYFTVYLDVAENMTGDQLKLITARYLRQLRTGKYAGYRAELDVRNGWNLFAVDNGRLPIVNTDQIVRQSNDWVALRREFPGATVRFRATIEHPGGQMPIQEFGHSNHATITLNGGADYTGVAATARTLTDRYAHLAGIDWTVNAGKDHPAQIVTSRRLPTAAELDVWNRLNADQAIRHFVRLRINGPNTPPIWISEETTRSRDVAVALQLAQRHLPIAATLPAPVLYTASDEPSGHIGDQGTARGPVSVTIGGCTKHDPLVYRPIPAEQALINKYETCSR